MTFDDMRGHPGLHRRGVFRPFPPLHPFPDPVGCLTVGLFLLLVVLVGIALVMLATRGN